MKNASSWLAAGILSLCSLGASASDTVAPSQDAIVSSIYITYDGTFEVGPGTIAAADEMYQRIASAFAGTARNDSPLNPLPGEFRSRSWDTGTTVYNRLERFGYEISALPSGMNLPAPGVYPNAPMPAPSGFNETHGPSMGWRLVWETKREKPTGEGPGEESSR